MQRRPRTAVALLAAALLLLWSAAGGAAERGPAERGPADRGPAERGPADRGAANRYSGQGIGVIVGGNLETAEKTAYRSARSQALRQAMDDYVRDNGIDTARYNRVRGEILAAADEIIAGERVLQRETSGGVVRLQLEFVIDEESLARAMGVDGLASASLVKARQARRPTTVVIVAEELNGTINSFPYSARLIQQRLSEADFPVVDQTAADRSARHEQAVQAMLANDVNSARAAALQFDADLMITGRAVAQVSSLQGGGMQAYGANIALSAIAADTGRVLASSSADANYPHVNAITGSRRALEGAAGKAMDDLLTKLEAQDFAPSTALRLTVNGVNYQQLAILKKILAKEFPQVASIDTRAFAGDVARLDVSLSGSVVEFAERLAAKDFGGFRLRVLSQSGEKIDTALVTG